MIAGSLFDALLLVALVADRDASIGAIYEPDDGRPDGWSHRDFARAIGRAMGRGRVATLTISPALLKAGGWLDPMLRRDYWGRVTDPWEPKKQPTPVAGGWKPPRPDNR